MAEIPFTFKRYEYKYILTPEQLTFLQDRLKDKIRPDRFFSSTVCSIYYDTADFELIRRSVEKPVYKEKLRLRSYNVPQPDSEVFVELKKKYKGVVYKRRIAMPETQAEAYLAGRAPSPEASQISREIDWFLSRNAVSPKVFIAADREAYVSCENPELRFTFDRSIRWRTTDLNLCHGHAGQLLLPEGQCLMELKIPQAAPIWLADLLSEAGVFPQGFSKYGQCYKTGILPAITQNGVFDYV